MLNNKTEIKIALIPIDNRPICYDLISDILSINKNIKIFLPEIKDLGGLTTSADINNLFNFLENLPAVDYLILSLDTLSYGGLVTSRRCEDEFDEIKNRILKFKDIVKEKCSKILAFSSIMRISNNNINEEEKIYWSDYGKKIFDWSYNISKSYITKDTNKGTDKIINNIAETIYNPNFMDNSIANISNTQIPEEILKDYLKTRKRNFEINKLYLNLAKENFFNTLIFSKDDCADFGLNILEADILEDLINKQNIKNTFIKTGADEIPLSLITRAIVGYYEEKNNKKIKINPVFLEENSTNLISKYEDISIQNCTLSQISLGDLQTDDKNPDLNFIINNFEKEQGDLVLGDVVNSITNKTLEKFNLILSKNPPFFTADVNNANGADCEYVENLFFSVKKELNFDNFFGYCAYNTSANTIGCVILQAVVKFVALSEDSFNETAFKKLILIRLLDDWVYQAITRKYVREKGARNNDFNSKLKEKTEELNKYAQKICKILNFYPDKITYSLPWDRSFEIRIEIE